VAECKCVARIVAPDPQRGGPDSMFVEGTITVVHEPLDLHARAEAMQTALREDLEDAEVSLQETGEEARWALKQIIKRAQAALDGSAP